MKRIATILVTALCASSASAWQYTAPQSRYVPQTTIPKPFVAQPWTATTIGAGSGFSTTTIQPPPLSRLPAVHCTTIDLGGISTMTCR
jgi:hypothetical protein